MKPERIRLKKLHNVRDLGGMVTTDGRTIKYGKLIRSDELFHLPLSTVNALKKIGLTTIIDLRICAGCNDRPDTVIEGCRYIWLPLPTTPAPCNTCEQTMRLTLEKESYRIKEEFGNMDNYMIQMYRNVLFDADSQEGLKKFLRILSDEEGCILWHCASGKDRTGICAMLVEALLGISESVIMDDYMASRRGWRSRYFLNRLVLSFAPISNRFRKILFGFMRTKRKYLGTVIMELKTRYGGVVEYCKAELGITDEDINNLRMKYLEQKNETD